MWGCQNMRITLRSQYMLTADTLTLPLTVFISVTNLHAVSVVMARVSGGYP